MQMAERKLIEIYAVLLVLCTALLIFGITQMQFFLSGILSERDFLASQNFMTSIQVSALGLILCALILVLFLRRFRKKARKKS